MRYISISFMVIALAASANAGVVEYFNEAAFHSAAGSTTLVNFDELTPGNGKLIGNEYAGIGLTIVQRDQIPINVLRYGGGDTSFITLNGFPLSINSAPNVISSSGVNGGFGHIDAFTDNFDFIFASPVTAASLYVGNIGPGVTEVQFLRPDGSVLANEVFDNTHVGLIGSGFNNRIFYGVTTDELIGRIRTVENAFDADGIVYDDIRFSSSSANAVPEPSGLTLAYLGISLFAGWARFRTRWRSVA